MARVEAGVTNLNITNAVGHEGFFYAPDPSSQLACTIAGNIAMNSGGAHCLKYGVTTNNVLGVRMVLIDGTIVEIGGAHLDSAGYDLLGLVVGSEGQLGIVTEATVRILRAAEGARPMLMGFAAPRPPAPASRRSSAPASCRSRSSTWTGPAIKVCEAFAHAGYPLDVEALLIVEVEGSEPEIADLIGRITAIAEPFRRRPCASRSRKPRARRSGRAARPPSAPWAGSPTISAWTASSRPAACRRCSGGSARSARATASMSPTSSTPATATCIPLILFNANESGGAREGRGARRRYPEALRRGRRLPHRRARRRRREARPDAATSSHPVDLEQQMRVKDVFDPHWLLNPAKVFPLDSRPALPSMP